MKIDSDEQQRIQKNPVKRAQRQKQFRTAGMLKAIFRQPQDMWNALKQYDKTLKSVQNAHPKYKDLLVVDFSLAARGPQEDQVYSERPFFRNNVRRGNTLVIDRKTNQVHWGRKGLIKFFDLSDHMIKAIIQGNALNLKKKDQPLYGAIFSEIQNVLSCNQQLQIQNKAKVHVYRLNKANGQNAQIGYFGKTDQWIISSKNVSIMLADPIQIRKYQGQRYQFAILMARTWFQMIKNHTPAQLRQLKQQLQGRTIVGEYCGNPDFQHLVKYNETTIYFYAMVQNHSQYSCLPPPQTFKFLQKHRLPIVKNYQKSFYGKFVELGELGKALRTLFEQVATSSIFEQQQGSVLYFVLEKPQIFCQFVSDRYLQQTVPIPANYKDQPVWFNVSSLSKLKTLQYRILRKLRQKLKYFTRIKKTQDSQQKNQNDQKKMQQKYGSFQREVRQLVQGRQLSKPVKYFFCAAIVAFDYVFKNRKNQRNLKLLSQHYLDFLSVIFWSIEHRKEVTPAMMADEELHLQLRGTTWQQYGLDVVEHYEELLAKLAPKYAKIKKSMPEGEEEQDEPQVQ